MTNPLGYASTTVYDVASQVVAIVNPLGFRFTLGYDVAGQRVTSQNPLGAVSTTLYDEAGRTSSRVNALGYRTTTVYDAASRQIATEDANGQRTTTIFNNAGQRIGQQNALGYVTTTVLDSAGQTLALVDAKGNRNSFTHDPKGRTTQQMDPLGRITTTGYDAAGRKTLRVDARGNRTSYTLDAVGQLTLRQYPDNSRHTFAWDQVGNRTKMQDTTGCYTYTYDSLNRLTTSTNAFSKMLTYTYDRASQRTTMVVPDVGSFTYSWDAAGQLASILSPLNEWTTFTNDGVGRRTLQQNANGTKASYTYDQADQLTQLFNLKFDGTVIAGFTYANDATGNRTAVLESSGDRVTWSYDRSYQLTNEARSGLNKYNTTFTYDAVGNRLVHNADGALTTYAYDAANQLVTHKDSAGTTNYTFDASGNQQVVVAPSGTRTTTTWDYESQPTQFQDQAGVLQTAGYNAEKLRFEKVVSGTTTRFLWDGMRYVAEFDGTNVVKLLYSGEPTAYGSVYSQSSKSGAIWTPRQFHADCIGSVRSITDSTAIVTDTRLFAAFGTTVASSGSTAAALKYCGVHGYYGDFGTQYYVRARMYDCVLGMFTGRAPALYEGGSFLLAYVAASPMIRIDSSGAKPRGAARTNPDQPKDDRQIKDERPPQRDFPGEPLEISDEDKLPCRNNTKGPTIVRVCVRHLRDNHGDPTLIGGHVFLRIECGGAAEEYAWSGGPAPPIESCKDKCGKRQQLRSWYAKFAPLTKENPLATDYPQNDETQVCHKYLIDKSPKDVIDCLFRFGQASRKCCIPYEAIPIGDPEKGCNSNCFAYWAATTCFAPILRGGTLDLPPDRPKPTPGWGKPIPECITNALEGQK